jgi:hypothetical protein
MLGMVESRRRWRHLVLLTVLVGVVGAVVLATAAGARRSATALDRFDAQSRAANLELSVGSPTDAQLQEFRRAAGVEAMAVLRGGAFVVPSAPQLQAIATATDRAFGTVVDRARVIDGRRARPGAVDEVNIGEVLAAAAHVHVGDGLVMKSYSPATVDGLLDGSITGDPPLDGPTVRLHVVGIVRYPLDLGDRGASGGALVTTPAFDRVYRSRIGSFSGDILRVRTAHGASDAAEVADAARRIFGASPQFGVTDLAVETQGARNAIDVLVVALWVFAGVTALAGLVAITLVMNRALSGTDQGIQHALGLTRRQRIAVVVWQSGPVVIVGSVLAVVGAVAASPLFPVGVARRAETHLGVHFDGLVLGAGLLAVAAITLALAVVAAVRTTHLGATGVETHGLAANAVDAASRAGITPVATTGARMALDPGRGATKVPVRSAMFGAVVGVVGVVAVMVFAVSLDRVAGNAPRYGWTWGFAAVADQPRAVDRATVTREPGIAAAAHLTVVGLQVDGRPVTAWAIRPLERRISPEIVTGRAPRTAHELAVGEGTLGELGKGIGDTVRMQGPNGSGRYLVVGTTVFPTLDNSQALANGVLVTSHGMDRLVSERNLTSGGSDYLAVTPKPGTPVAPLEHRLEHDLPLEPVLSATVPVEVDRLRHVNWIVVTLAAVLSFLALVAVGHALVTSVRRRRGDLAVLKTLGFDQRQVRGAVAWQATTMAVIGLLVGIPCGLFVGDVVWRAIADSLGIQSSAPIPALALGALVPCAIVAVNLLAFLPARAAARIRPAIALRAE